MLLRVTFCSLLAFATADTVLAGRFQWLGVLPGDQASSATAISPDGTIVVGTSGQINTVPDPPVAGQPFRWSSTQGMQPLGGTGAPSGASNDGGVIVADLNNWQGLPRASRFISDWESLDPLPGGVATGANGVSADGSTTVGWSGTPVGLEAVRWTSDGAVQSLHGSQLARPSRATAVSRDGVVIVGSYILPGWGQQAFRWTESDGMMSLGQSFGSVATAVSADGSVIAGYVTHVNNDQTDSPIAFRWTQETGIVIIGDLNSKTTGISGDGSLVIGYHSDLPHSNGIYSPWVWDAANGQRTLSSFFTEHGVIFSGELITVTAVSSDGRTFVGAGVNPSGLTQAWVATIPEPAGWSLMMTGLMIAWPLARVLRACRRNRKAL